jgi:integrase
MKISKADRYKTVSLKTADIEVARERAFDQDADIRFRLKHNVPVFNHPFREVGREYLLIQKARAKGKSRQLVAPKSVGDYLERIRVISKATQPDNRVFTTITGKSAKTLYSSLIADLLNEANLREGTQGVPRSTYCFRHTYATLRLQEGVDVYFLAEQMGTAAAGRGQGQGVESGGDTRQRQKRSAPQAALTMNLPKPFFAGAVAEAGARRGPS